MRAALLVFFLSCINMINAKSGFGQLGEILNPMINSFEDKVDQFRRMFQDYEAPSYEEVLMVYSSVSQKPTFRNVALLLRTYLEYGTATVWSTVSPPSTRGIKFVLRNLKSYFDKTAGRSNFYNPWTHLQLHRKGNNTLKKIIILLFLFAILVMIFSGFKITTISFFVLFTLILGIFGGTQSLFYLYSSVLFLFNSISFVILYSPILIITALMKGYTTYVILLAAGLLLFCQTRILSCRNNTCSKESHSADTSAEVLSQRIEMLSKRIEKLTERVNKLEKKH